MRSRLRNAVSSCEEIEAPFRTDGNDLPIAQIAGKIRSNLNEILSQEV